MKLESFRACREALLVGDDTAGHLLSTSLLPIDYSHHYPPDIALLPIHAPFTRLPDGRIGTGGHCVGETRTIPSRRKIGGGQYHIGEGRAHERYTTFTKTTSSNMFNQANTSQIYHCKLIFDHSNRFSIHFTEYSIWHSPISTLYS